MPNIHGGSKSRTYFECLQDVMNGTLSLDAVATLALSGEVDFVLVYSRDYAASNARCILAIETNIAGVNAGPAARLAPRTPATRSPSTVMLICRSARSSWPTPPCRAAASSQDTLP